MFFGWAISAKGQYVSLSWDGAGCQHPSHRNLPCIPGVSSDFANRYHMALFGKCDNSTTVIVIKPQEMVGHSQV